jgi:hypothetical protein
MMHDDGQIHDDLEEAVARSGCLASPSWGRFRVKTANKGVYGVGCAGGCRITWGGCGYC